MISAKIAFYGIAFLVLALIAMPAHALAVMGPLESAPLAASVQAPAAVSAGSSASYNPYSMWYLTAVPNYYNYAYSPYYYSYPYSAYGYYPYYYNSFYTFTYSTPTAHVSYTNYGGYLQSGTVVIKKSDWFLAGGYAKVSSGSSSYAIYGSYDKRSLFAMG